MAPISTHSVLDLLRQFESQNVTYLDPDGTWPMVWHRARGLFAWDPEGKKYLDLTAAFGVAAAGHANPRVVRAGRAQMSRLLHAMGDVHPHAGKALLARELSRLTFERWNNVAPRAGPSAASRPLSAHVTGKTIFCSSGFEAVEAALKTALLATGRRGIIAFRGGYHGLGYGALNATERSHFRGPFLSQLSRFGHFLPFPTTIDGLEAFESGFRRLTGRRQIGAVVVEPVQTRGGINVPPPGFLSRLRQLCTETGSLLILDEIYTGFGRTGRWFACEHEEVQPDLICLGKALAGGFPLSACVGRADLMDRSWPASNGEAIHTSTFLGHPVGCAMALAQIEEVRARGLVEQAARLGGWLLERLRQIQPTGLNPVARGLGLLAGLELRNADGSPATETSLRVIKQMLALGFILLPEGEHANVIAFTPPLSITERQLDRALTVLKGLLELSRRRTAATGSRAGMISRANPI